MDNLAEGSTLLGMPREYAFLLIGGVVGFLLGFLAGKLVVDPSASRAAKAAPREPEAPEPAGVNLVINGQVVDIPPAALNEIHGLLQANNKIDAVKCLREATGLGLAEAKTVVESLAKVAR